MPAQDRGEGRRLEARRRGARGVVQEDRELWDGVRSYRQVSYAMRGRAEDGGEETDAVVDLFAAEAADVLDHGGDLGRAAEEDEDLVDGVCGEVVGEPVRWQREFLPGALELSAEPVESKRRCMISAKRPEGTYPEHTSTQTQRAFPKTWGGQREARGAS